MDPTYIPVTHSHRPWVLKARSGSTGDICDSDGKVIAAVNLVEPVGLANARLIAAAPDLLAAVKAFETFYLDIRPVLDAHGADAHVFAVSNHVVPMPAAVALALEALRRVDGERPPVQRGL